MAEWSKATDSSSVLPGGVSSNLTGCNTIHEKYYFFFSRLKDSMVQISKLYDQNYIFFIKLFTIILIFFYKIFLLLWSIIQ